MRITPLDVRKQEFRKAVRGYDSDEVRAFLTTLADEYETVLVDNKQLRERIMEQEDKIGEYKTMERTLRDTLMTAERLMQDTRESAGKEGELIVRDAHMKARQILEECRTRTEELRRETGGPAQGEGDLPGPLQVPGRGPDQLHRDPPQRLPGPGQAPDLHGRRGARGRGRVGPQAGRRPWPSSPRPHRAPPARAGGAGLVESRCRRRDQDLADDDDAGGRAASPARPCRSTTPGATTSP